MQRDEGDSWLWEPVTEQVVMKTNHSGLGHYGARRVRTAVHSAAPDFFAESVRS